MPDPIVVPSRAMPSVEDQVRALVERLTPTNARIDYVTDLLKPMLGADVALSRNAFYAASQLLGCSPARARDVIGMVARRGSAEAAQAWLAMAPPLPPLAVSPLATNLVGFIYFAKLVTDTNVMRVGFTANLARRLRDLRAETGEDFQIHHWFVGTTVDEAVAQFTLADKRITGKFVFAGEPGQIPGFLPMGLEGMRRALGNDLLKGRVAA